MNETRNQALTMYTDFFDPIHSSARVKLNPGTSKLVSVYFREEKPCVTVLEDGTVEFTFENCKGKTVAVSGFGGNFPEGKIYLKNDGMGNFRIKIPHFPPGLHYYRWYVDDVAVVHANAGIHFGCFQVLNMFEVPEDGVDFYFVKPVEHGKVHMCKYVSSLNNHLKQCYVYTPPGYETDQTEKYPVLYLQHGIGGNETSWTWLGKCNFILDNLIYEKKCAKMIVVMTSGYSFGDEESNIYRPEDYREELVHNIIPLIEHNFRTINNATGRAIAGIAYGAEQSILTVNQSGKDFGALGIFSGYVESLDVTLAKNMLLYLGCGNHEDMVRKQQDEFCERKEELEKSGVQIVRRIYDGYHEWHVWRKCFRDFLTLIFHQVKKDSETALKEQKKDAFPTGKYETTNVPQGSAVFFDPIYKRIRTSVDGNGNRHKELIGIRKGIELMPNGKVKLSFYAPGAESIVAEIFGMEKRVLFPEKDGNGYFSDILPRVDAGVHYVQFYMNGVEVINPDAPISFGCYRTMNYMEVPDKQLITMRKSRVPHGRITMNYYHSRETNREKLCYIYTPAEYQENDDKRYPVLYLQHGSGENELGWIHQGNLAEIVDYMIANHKMKPTIIVMNAGYSHSPGEELHTTYKKFAKELVYDCVPFVDSQYRTLPEGEFRAVAGISMGGAQAQFVSYEYPEKFQWLGSFSGGIKIPRKQAETEREINEKYDRFKSNNKLIFIACARSDDFYKETYRMSEMVANAGFPIKTFWEDGQHDWTFWRHAFVNFIPHLWKEP